ncbi:MAG: TRAP transporter substrate-binding protein DctP [Deinococcota bacterium]|nr:TRAP transporter substrate-binding protein DctP [Deinococcota bacterium]
MKRRDFIKRAVVATAASSTLSPLVFAQNRDRNLSFEMVTSWPTSLENLHGGATNIARLVSAMTGGDVSIEVFPAGAQVGALEVYDAVSSGAFAMGHTASYYYIGQRQAHGFFTAMPFGMNAQQHNAWMYAGNGQNYWNEINAPDNLIAFTAGNTGTQMGGWFRREINTIADLRGLTVRIPALGGQVMARAGVDVQLIPGGETYLALETGRIDAVEWVGPFDDQILGFQNAAPYYYSPGWQEPGAALGLYINLDVYNSLDADIQEVIQAACQAANTQMLAAYDTRNSTALEELVAGGTELRTFSDEILSEFKRSSDAINEESIAADPFFAEVFEDWSAFRDNIRGFHRVGEYAYQRLVYEVGL